MLKVWGRASAFNVQKAMWAVGEVGAPYERHDLGGAFGGLDDPDFRAMNPNGRIPVIDDDGVIVWESNAIIRYLAARYAVGTLWDPDPARRAVADQWMDWMQATLYRHFMDLFWGLVRTPAEQWDWPAIRAAKERLARHYGILDRTLATRPYLAGDQFSMADIPAGTTLYRYYEMEIDRPRLDHVRSWYERLAERPAYRSHVMVPFDELVGRTTY
jgi:glutathione S-transferase